MIERLPLVLLAAVSLCCLSSAESPQPSCDQDVQNEAVEILKEFDNVMKTIRPISSRASWAYDTNLTQYNQERMLEAGRKYSEAKATAAEKGSDINATLLCCEATKKELDEMLDYRYSGNQTEKVKSIKNRISRIEADLAKIYSSAKTCLRTDKDVCIGIEPGLTKLLRESRNEKVLSKAWKGWRDETGKKMKKLYVEHVELNMERRKGKTYTRSDNWKYPYVSGDKDFENDVENLLAQVKPLYQQLHAFARRRLQKIYKDYQFPESGLIPAHLLGNMWAQSWEHMYKELMPYPDQKAIDITEEMKAQNYTVHKMFKVAEDFFTSMGLKAMTPEFWNNSMLVKPQGRDVVCHASAWDFGDGKDFRIKMCTTINQEDFITIHHEMGHIQYDMQYSDLPTVFHGGANPGFHEAVGDTLALSVSTTKHLKEINLLDKDTKENLETDMNYLMSIALQKIVFPPFAYVIDRWRWDVFDGKTTPDQYNQHWWYLRCKHQGLVPPVQRSSTDFDPGAKYHVPADVPYIRYFVSFIIQFQFYEALCKAAGHPDSEPLYKCDFYKNKEAGKKFSEMLQLGSSKSWPDALESITGSRKMDVRPLKRYFEPLIKYLEDVNDSDEMGVGWDERCKNPMSPPKFDDKQAVTTNRPATNQPTKNQPTKNQPTETTTPSSASSWKPGLVGIFLGTVLQICLLFVVGLIF